MNPSLASRHAPSFALIQAHCGAGLAGACLFAAALVATAISLEGDFFQGAFLGLVHLCVLGWLMPIAIGAMHQLVPVVFEVPVRSERAAWIAFALYVVGVAALVGQMWTLQNGWTFAGAGVLVAASIWIYAANLLATLARTRTRTLTGRYVIASLAWLLVAVTLGASLAVHLHAPWLRINHLQLLRVHAHTAGLGFFGLLIMGVAYRLLEMFMLSYGADERAGRIAFVATNAGLVLLTFGLGLPHQALTAAGGVLVAVGVLCFLVQIRLIWRRRTRRKSEAAQSLTLASFAHLLVVALLGTALAALDFEQETLNRLTLAYGLLALPGFVGSVVVGQLYKILPFLVWLHRFAPYVGLKQVPSASEILPEGPRRLQAITMQAGLLILAAGLIAASPWLRVLGAAVFAASMLLATRNFVTILRSQP